jgi:hypothetical protein
MRHTIALLFAVTLLSASAYQPPRKRAICTANSLNNPLVDDVPNIVAALKECGDSGRVVLPDNQTFTIRSPIDLSLCRSCDFQINGIVKVSPDWDYWSKQSAVFKIWNATAVIIRPEWDSAVPGVQGIIDAQFFGLDPTSISFPIPRIPKLFSIKDKSYQIHTRGLRVRNVPGTAFYVSSNSTAIRFYDVAIETPADTAFEVDGAHHTYLWNNTIRASDACVRINPNSSNIQVEESTCITTSSGTSSAASGIEINFGVGAGVNWVRNIFVRKVKASGGMNAIKIGGGNGDNIEIKNATFTDVTVEGPARRAVLLDQGDTRLNITGVTFRGFEGEAEEESALVCSNKDDICEFKTENWNVVHGR